MAEAAYGTRPSGKHILNSTTASQYVRISHPGRRTWERRGTDRPRSHWVRSTAECWYRAGPGACRTARPLWRGRQVQTGR